MGVVSNTKGINKYIWIIKESSWRIYDLQKVNFTEDYFTEKIKALKKLLHNWAFRNLTIFGNVTVVKTLALPIQVQCMSVLHDPKTKQFKEIQKIILDYIWDGKIDNTRRKIINDKHNGG